MAKWNCSKQGRGPTMLIMRLLREPTLRAASRDDVRSIKGRPGTQPVKANPLSSRRPDGGTQ